MTTEDEQRVVIREDPDLTQMEKETTVTWAKDQERVHIHSEMGSIVRWLLDHPDFEEAGRRLNNGEIHAVRGTLPVGCLKLQATPRKSSRPSDVTSRFADGGNDG